MRLIDADLLTERLNNAIECGRRVDMPTLELEAVLANVQNAPTIDIEPKRGEWEEKETFHNADDNPIIEEWQSARCSVCHKYHTTPYMYYFNNYNFCPNCGADMRERGGE